VVKHRTLFLVGRTRVHLDRIEGLGHFLELEVVLGENDSSEWGVREAHTLMSHLGIEPHPAGGGSLCRAVLRRGHLAPPSRGQSQAGFVCVDLAGISAVFALSVPLMPNVRCLRQCR